MTKKIQRILSFILAVAMVLTVCNFSVFAEVDTTTKHTITINEKTNYHQYKIYQIFGGSITTNTENPSATPELTDIVYGSGVTAGDTAPKAAALAKTIAEDVNRPADPTYYGDEIVKILTDNGVELNETPTTTINYDVNAATEAKYVSGPLSVGYYLIVDSLTGEAADKEDVVISSYIVQILDEDLTVNPKSSVPTVEKTVTDVNDTTGVEVPDQKTADYDIGDLVPFKLVGTLPTNYADYDAYEYIFHDTLSKGLTYDETKSELVVKVGDSVIDSSCYTPNATKNEDGTTALTITFTDLKTAVTDPETTIDKDSQIVVTYKATLNEDAVIGSTGNPNDVYLEFDNNPNGTGKGKTPTDQVIVFTYKTVFNKKDGANDQPLTGADFKLYKLTPAVLPDGATATTIDNLPKGEDVPAGTYLSYNENTYNLVEVTNKDTVTDDTTTFTFNGIDDGTYLLVETKTPAGYNAIAPLPFEVTATHDDTQLTDLVGDGGAELTLTKSDDNASLSADIINNSGSTLPETGGMGTKIFYAVGGVLVVAAGVLLIARRRMRNS